MNKGEELDYLPGERSSSTNMAERSLACTRQKAVIVDNRFECEHSTDKDSKDVFTGEFSLSMCYLHPVRETVSGKGYR